MGTQETSRGEDPPFPPSLAGFLAARGCRLGRHTDQACSGPGWPGRGVCLGRDLQREIQGIGKTFVSKGEV